MGTGALAPVPPELLNVMKKVISATLILILMCGLLMGCNQPENPSTQPSPTVCDHYDMDVDNLCDECGESLLKETEPAPTQTQPEHGDVVLRLYVEYTLGAYSSGRTTMLLYDSYVAVVESVVDTSAVGQGQQNINETGTWTYNAGENTYTVNFGSDAYTIAKNADGQYSVQYSFAMKGQTGGSQDISVVLVETPTT